MLNAQSWFGVSLEEGGLQFSIPSNSRRFETLLNLANGTGGAFSLELGGMDIVISNIYLFTQDDFNNIILLGIFCVRMIYKREHHDNDDDE